MTHPQQRKELAEARLLRKRLAVLKRYEALYVPSEWQELYIAPLSVTSLPRFIETLQKLDRKKFDADRVGRKTKRRTSSKKSGSDKK